MSFEDWLASRYAPSTAAAYARIARLFCAACPAAIADYNDVAAWIGSVRARTPNPATVGPHLSALRVFFTWQVESGKRSDNPARAFILADKPSRETHLPQLLTPQELRVLRARSASLAPRERVIIDCLSFSALTSREVVNLRPGDVNLASGRLRVRATRRSDERLILLPRQQCEHLGDYLSNERPALNHAGPDRLIITRRRNAETPDGVQRVVQNVRPLVPGRRLTPTLIRQSVLAMMLNAGHDLRSVQLFAGHRHPGTTERYRFTGLEELKAAVTKHHPME